MSDLVTGLLPTLAAPALEGESVDIGSGELTDIHEVVEWLRPLIDPTITPSYEALAPHPEEQVRRADTRASQRLIG